MKAYLLKFIDRFTKDQVGLYSTQAAFFFIVSAVPFFMFLLSLIKFILPMSDLEVIELINASLPDSLQYYASMIFEDLYTQTSISLASITAITTLWASSKGTFALTQGLDAIHKTSGTGAKNYVLSRIMSLFNTLLFMIVLIFSIIVLLFGGRIKALLIAFFPKQLASLINFLDIKSIVAIIVITFLFSILYAVLPSKKQNVFKQIPGAFIATLGWLLFSSFYALYIDNFSNFSFTYGILAAAIFMMLWLKTCMMIFLIGGELNTKALTLLQFIKKK